jgi:hypothetical protein
VASAEIVSCLFFVVCLLFLFVFVSLSLVGFVVFLSTQSELALICFDMLCYVVLFVVFANDLFLSGIAKTWRHWNQ